MPCPRALHHDHRAATEDRTRFQIPNANRSTTADSFTHTYNTDLLRSRTLHTRTIPTSYDLVRQLLNQVEVFYPNTDLWISFPGSGILLTSQSKLNLDIINEILVFNHWTNNLSHQSTMDMQLEHEIIMFVIVNWQLIDY